MTDLFHPDERCCGSCRYWQQNTGEYSASKRTCDNPRCGWYRSPKEYINGVGCGFWDEA